MAAPRAAAGPLQRAGRRAAGHRRARHQPAAGLARAAHGPRRPRHPPSGDVADEDLPKPAIRPYPRTVRQGLEVSERPSTSSSGPSGPRTSRWSSTSTAGSPTSRSTSATSPSSATSSASLTSGWCASASPTTTARSPWWRSRSNPRPAGSASAASPGSSACATRTTPSSRSSSADECQGQGLGTEMVRRLIEVGARGGHRAHRGRDPRHQQRHAPHLPGAGLHHRTPTRTVRPSTRRWSSPRSVTALSSP